MSVSFSVIVPVHNASASLKACVDSVIDQRYKDWELLLIDDGSTDGSGIIIDDYERDDPRIKAFHQVNAGAFVARRTGIENSLGDYILFLDSDDLLDGDIMPILCSAAERNDPDIIMYVGRYRFDGSDKGRLFGYLGKSEKMICIDSLKRSVISSHDHNSLCIKAFKRTLFEGDDNNYEDMTGKCIGEDKVQLLYPLSRASNAYYIPDELYIYNIRDDSSVHSIGLGSADRFLANNMFLHLYSFMQKWGMTGKDSLEALNAYYIRNFLSAYYGVRKSCDSAGMLLRFRRYHWNLLDDEPFKIRFNRLLSTKEIIKLLAAKLHL